MPKLRFPEFRGNGGWKSAKIGDFIESYKGGASLTPSDFTNNLHYEVIPKKAITEGMWLKMDIKNPTCCKECFYKSNLQSVVDSDYLITTLRDLVPSGPNIGYIVKYTGNKKYILAQGVYGLKPKKTIISDYLIHFSNTEKYRRMMQSVMVGSTQVHIRNSVYLNLPLIIPSLPEQQKIADCLSSLDEFITAETQKLEVYKDHKKGLMQKLFPAEGETVPRLRFSEFQAVGEWGMQRLDEVGKIVTGKTPSTSDESLWNGDIQFVTPTDITEKKYQNNTQRTVVHNVKMNILPKHSTMFTCIASIGKMSLSVFPCITNQQINSIIPYEEFENEFIYYALLKISYLIKSKLASTTLPIINKTEFSQFLIPIPSIQEQQKIADCLSSLDELITAEVQKLDALKAHKKGLMQGLFPSTDEVHA